MNAEKLKVLVRLAVEEKNNFNFPTSQIKIAWNQTGWKVKIKEKFEHKK